MLVINDSNDSNDTCEWNPETSDYSKIGEHIVPAEYVVGKKLRLCSECAKLPKFAKMKHKKIEKKGALSDGFKILQRL